MRSQDIHRAAQRRSAKHVINTHLTLRGTLNRHRQHHRHRQHTCLSQMGRPDLQKGWWPFFTFPTTEMAPGVLFFCSSRKWSKQSKMREPICEKFDAFLQCALSPLVRNKFLFTNVSNSMHFWSINFLYMIFVFSRFHVVVTPKKVAQTRYKWSHSEFQVRHEAQGWPATL